MVYVGSKDYLEIYGASIISNVDIDVLSRLYQPIIGHKAAMLYLTLMNYIKHNEGELLTHDDLFTLMQITSAEFLNARKALEASGLLKSYLKIDDDIKKYVYVVYSPKAPNVFFDDVLFKGLLVRYIGETAAYKLALHYQINIDLTGMKEITASFVDVFHPDFKDSCFDAKMPSNLKGNKAIKIGTDFSPEKFFSHLKVALMINESAISKEEVEEIERIATLYGIDTLTIADIVAETYDENKRKGSRIDMTTLKERAINEAKYKIVNKKVNEQEKWVRISGKTSLAKEIDIMQNPNTSPSDYLSMKQDGAPVVTSDLRLLDYLNDNMGLSRPVINALINYCLKMCDNRLNRNYVEKVAASLKREKIDNALDAINYLENKKSATKNPITSKPKKENKVVEESRDDESYDEDEYNELIKSLSRRK